MRMRKEKNELLKYTQEVWQPYASDRLSTEDARQCVENICGFFDVLKEWEERAGGHISNSEGRASNSKPSSVTKRIA